MGTLSCFFQECYSARELVTRLFSAANSWLNGPHQGIQYVYLLSNLWTMAKTMGCDMKNPFSEVKHIYCTNFMLTVSHDGNSVIYNNYIEMKLAKNMNNVWNQNVNMTK